MRTEDRPWRAPRTQPSQKRGQSHLQISGVRDLSDIDKEHIAELVKEGFTSGEIIQETEEEAEQA